VVGAAGSTGKAAVRCLLADRPDRRLILVEHSHRVGLVPAPAGRPGQHRITADRAAIRDAAIVVCVTNAPGSILTAYDFGPGCVVLDDAQPENVSHADLGGRPDLAVVKCLARVAGLRNPFDFGLFAPESHAALQELTFTCLAETVLLAAAGHIGPFTIGDPRDEQLAFLRRAAPIHGVGIAPFHSFPEVGFVRLDGRPTPSVARRTGGRADPDYGVRA
jgi:predicted amino acid dehydrogenase